VLCDPLNCNSPCVSSFAPYILFEVPGNLLLKRFRPRIWSESHSSLVFLQPCRALTCLPPSSRMHVRFRVHYHRSGSREELLWTSRRSFLLGGGRGKHLSWMRLSHFHVRLPSCIRGTTTLSFAIRWYKREEAQKRFTAFLASTSLAAAFGGLFAYAVSKLDGAAGLASWRWVFIVGASLFPSPKVTH